MLNTKQQLRSITFLSAAVFGTVPSTAHTDPVHDYTPDYVQTITSHHQHLAFALRVYALKNQTPNQPPALPTDLESMHASTLLDIPTFTSNQDVARAPWAMPIKNIPVFFAPTSAFIYNDLCAAINKSVGIPTIPLPTQFNPAYSLQCYQSASKEQNLVVSYSGNHKNLQSPTSDITEYIPISEIADYPNKRLLKHQNVPN